jgi:hypothetical protein
MVGQEQNNQQNNYVTCCFCGEEISLAESVQIVVYPNQDSESQSIYAHKKCINNTLHSSIPRHPDLLPDD